MFASESRTTVLPMSASPAPIDSPAPAPRPRPHLHAVPTPVRRRRPRRDDVRVYALGLMIGFLLAAVATAPGGSLVLVPVLGAAVSGTVAGMLALRGRARPVRPVTDPR